MIVSTPRRFSSRAARLAVSTSSRKEMPWMPGLRDQSGRRLEGHPDVADLDPAYLLDHGAGQDGPTGAVPDHVGGQPAEVGAGVFTPAPRAVAAVVRVAAAALHPQQFRPHLRRTRGCPRSTRPGRGRSATRRPARRGTSPERNGDPPIRSPAATVCEFFAPSRSSVSVVDRYSAPPTRVSLGSRVSPSVSSVPVGGFRCPWKSLNDRTWSSISLGLGRASALWASPSEPAIRAKVAVTVARRRLTRIGVLPGGEVGSDTIERRPGLWPGSTAR